jgi:hypothetical protein
VIALAASVASFYLVENPLRHARLSRFGRWTPIGLGAVLIAVSLIVATVEIDVHAAPPTPTSLSSGKQSATPRIAGSVAEVEQAVRAAAKIEEIPADLTPALTNVRSTWGGPAAPCWPSVGQSSIPACMFGDLNSSHTMVVYGDSHAGMWFQTLELIATRIHWRLAYLGKGYCPANSLAYGNPDGYGSPGGEYSVCDRWHSFALDRINRLHPDLVIITQEVRNKPDGKYYSPAQWQQGMAKTISLIHVPKDRIVVLGNIPVLPTSGPECLSQHPDNVQACSGPVGSFWNSRDQAERTAVTEAGGRYLNVTPWFCSSTCTAVIGDYEVYWDDAHITTTYAEFLAGVLAASLPLSLPSGLFQMAAPTTSVSVPANGATLSGSDFLDAVTSGTPLPKVTSVRFEITGGTLRDHIISTSRRTDVGWLGAWNTTTVPDGTYTLQSVASYGKGKTVTSPGITITVANSL